MLPFLCLLALAVVVMVAAAAYVQQLLQGQEVLPLLFYRESALNTRIITRCGLRQRAFRPVRWLQSGHVQTLMAALLPRADGSQELTFQREYLQMRDKGVVALDWVTSATPRMRRKGSVLLVLPQVTGDAFTVAPLCGLAARRGFKVVVFNRRGHGGSVLTTPKLLNTCDPSDLRQVIKYLRLRYPKSQLAAVAHGSGCSLLISYLGEFGSSALLSASACVSPCYDSAERYAGGPPRSVYDLVQLLTLKAVVLRHAAALTPVLDVRRALLTCWTFRRFEEEVFYVLYARGGAGGGGSAAAPPKEKERSGFPTAALTLPHPASAAVLSPSTPLSSSSSTSAAVVATAANSQLPNRSRQPGVDTAGCLPTSLACRHQKNSSAARGDVADDVRRRSSSASRIFAKSSAFFPLADEAKTSSKISSSSSFSASPPDSRVDSCSRSRVRCSSAGHAGATGHVCFRTDQVRPYKGLRRSGAWPSHAQVRLPSASSVPATCPPPHRPSPLSLARPVPLSRGCCAASDGQSSALTHPNDVALVSSSKTSATVLLPSSVSPLTRNDASSDTVLRHTSLAASSDVRLFDDAPSEHPSVVLPSHEITNGYVALRGQCSQQCKSGSESKPSHDAAATVTSRASSECVNSLSVISYPDLLPSNLTTTDSLSDFHSSSQTTKESQTSLRPRLTSNLTRNLSPKRAQISAARTASSLSSSSSSLSSSSNSSVSQSSSRQCGISVQDRGNTVDARENQTTLIPTTGSGTDSRAPSTAPFSTRVTAPISSTVTEFSSTQTFSAPSLSSASSHSPNPFVASVNGTAVPATNATTSTASVASTKTPATTTSTASTVIPTAAAATSATATTTPVAEVGTKTTTSITATCSTAATTTAAPSIAASAATATAAASAATSTSTTVSSASLAAVAPTAVPPAPAAASAVAPTAAPLSASGSLSRHSTASSGSPAEDYWERQNPLRDVDEIAVPVLCVNGLDDPVYDSRHIPYDLFRCYPNFLLVATPRGGHCAFLEGGLPPRSWADALCLDYLQAVWECTAAPTSASASSSSSSSTTATARGLCATVGGSHGNALRRNTRSTI